MPTRKTTSATTTTAKKKKPASKPRKRVGDVLGISGARVPEGTPRATADRGGNPKGIELPGGRRRTGRLKPARVRG